MRHRYRRNQSHQVHCAWLVPTTLTPNGTWGDYVRGEWWITLDGDDMFADGDIGPAGHEQIAIDSMLDKDQLINAIVRGVLDCEPEDIAEAITTEVEDLRWDDEIGSSNVFAQYGCYVTDSSAEKLMRGGLKGWRLLQQDARAAFSRYWGAIHVINFEFSVWQLTPKSLTSMQNWLESKLEGDEVHPRDDTELCITEWESKRYNCLEINEFLTARHPRDVWGR